MLLRVVLALCLVAASRAEEAPAAKVTWVTGTVTVQRVGRQAPEELKVGTELFKGDRIEARPGADAGLLVGGEAKKLSGLPDARWTVGEPFAAPERSLVEQVKDKVMGPAPTSRQGGSDFAALLGGRGQPVSPGAAT